MTSDHRRSRRRKPRTPEVVAAADSLIGQLPESHTGQVEFLWPKIATALEQGHRPKEIWRTLHNAGLAVPLEQFRVYLWRMKQKAKRLSDETRPYADTPSVMASGRSVATETGASTRENHESGPPLDDTAQRALELLKKKNVQWKQPAHNTKNIF